MKKFKNFVIFILIPICVIFLLVFNGHLASKKYNTQEDINKNTYNAIIKPQVGKLTMKASEEKSIKVTLKNAGTMTWIPGEKNDIDLSYHILGNLDKAVVKEGERTKLPIPVKPGEELSVDAKVKAPDKQGTYKVEFDMVHEGVTWFKDKGSKSCNIVLEVK